MINSKKLVAITCLAMFITLFFSVTSHAAILLFKGKGFFFMNMQFDLKNFFFEV